MQFLQWFIHVRPALPNNIKGSRSGSTCKYYRKVKSPTDSLNKITAAKSKWHRP